jgi:hypothetical protein
MLPSGEQQSICCSPSLPPAVTECCTFNPPLHSDTNLEHIQSAVLLEQAFMCTPRVCLSLCLTVCVNCCLPAGPCPSVSTSSVPWAPTSCSAVT